MEDQHLATYYFFPEQTVDIYGVSYKDTPGGEFASYDLYVVLKDSRECINEGFYIFNWPSWNEVNELFTEWREKC